jgi:hypothetical protein
VRRLPSDLLIVRGAPFAVSAAANTAVSNPSLPASVALFSAARIVESFNRFDAIPEIAVSPGPIQN